MGPLSGLKVLDLGTIYAAPIAGTLLADLGAEVIKIEHPKGDAIRRWGHKKKGIYMSWKVVNRNKKAITLNLSKEEGQEIFRKLIKEVDVVIENFRPGVMKRWHLGYDDLQAINPRIIMVSISGWGQDGPKASCPGYGTLAEAVSGFAQLNGYPERPPTLPPTGLADSLAGVYGALGALAAVYHRDVQGSSRGQQIDIAIYEPLFSLLSTTALQITRFDQTGEVPHRLGNRSAFEAPRNLYRSKDGKWMAISTTNDTMAERAFTAMGMKDMLKDERFRTNDDRLSHVDEVDELVAKWMVSHNSVEIEELFNRFEAPIGMVYDVKDMFEDLQFKARKNIVRVLDPDFGEISLPGVVPVFSETPGAMRYPGVSLGYNNDEIYMKRLGMNAEELQSLKIRGVI